MIDISAIAPFACVAGGAALILVVVRALMTWAADRFTLATLGAESGRLRPAELAYLLHEGDMSNVMVVLVVDLIHRALKSQRAGDESFTLAPYEEKAWLRVKDFLREWGEDRLGKVMPDPQSDGLRQMGIKLSRIYRFFSRTVRSFIGEVISDPKRIRKYFSFSGVARLVADLGSSGCRQVIGQELAGELLARRLLATEAQRRRWAVLCSLVFAIALVSLAVAAAMLLPNHLFALVVVALGGCNATALRSALFLRDLLPLYVELKDVIEHVKRPGKRVTLARFVLRAIAGMTSALLACSVIVALVIEALTMKLALGALLSHAALGVAASTVYWLVAIRFGLDAWTLERRPKPSSTAMTLIRSTRSRLAHLSPFEEFKRLLSEPTYDPTFSEIVAVYGLETLWLLA